MRGSSLKYRFCASVDSVRYDAFDIKGARGLEAIVQTHIDSGSSFLKLYVEFSLPDEGFRTSMSVPIREAKTVENANSRTTQLCGGFTTLLGRFHYDIQESSMERRSSVSTLDFNRKRQNTEKLGYGGRTECTTPTRHLKKGTQPSISYFHLSLEDYPNTTEEREHMRKVHYASALGSFMYVILCKHPNICFVVRLMSRYLTNPSPRN